MEVLMKGIEKSFGHNHVLKGVNLSIQPGEVHALMGENGAGKSTLMNILTGLFPQDGGQIFIDGKEKQYLNPTQAEEDGIYFIHQEMITWPDMSVLDNLFMGRHLSNKLGLVDRQKMKKKAEASLDRLNVSIDLDQAMRDLSVGQQQLVEICKSLMGESNVIIMDEPTAALTEHETHHLFEIIKQLKKDGVAIIYISHRMNEIFEITDQLTVMRDGQSVISQPTSEMTEEAIVRNMVGRDLGDYYPDISSEKGKILFEAKDLAREGIFEDISFQLREGEILGVSGLMGAGRTEIMRSIFGIDSLDQGEMLFKGEKFNPSSPKESIEKGIGFLTENRKEEGLILDFSIRDNISLPVIDEFSTAGWISSKEELAMVNMLIERLRIKTTGYDQLAGDLSGGNQQKVVLAKWIGAQSQLLILDEPTRGVDIGAKQEIYQLMKELTDRHVGIIMVSSDLPEIIGISDRVLVVAEGRLAGEVSGDQITEENIMTLATGGN